MTPTTGRYEALIRDWCNRDGRRTMPQQMTTAQISEALRVSPETVTQWARKQRLPFVDVGRFGTRRYRFPTDQFIKWATDFQPLSPNKQ